MVAKVGAGAGAEAAAASAPVGPAAPVGAGAATAAAAALQQSPVIVRFQPATLTGTVPGNGSDGQWTFTYYIDKATRAFADQAPPDNEKHRFEIFTVRAKGVPRTISPEIAKQYWQMIVEGMQDELPPGKAAEVEVNKQDGTLTCFVPKGKDQQSFKYTEFAAASRDYANGRQAELETSLQQLQTLLREGTPLYSPAAPPFLTYSSQNCYIQAALQRLLARPELLGQLDAALARQNTPKKQAALEVLQRLVHTCVSRPEGTVSADELEVLRQALGDTAPTDSAAETAQAAAVRQQEPEDAATAFTRIKDLILGEHPDPAIAQPELITTLTLAGAEPSVTRNPDGELHLTVSQGQGAAVPLPQLIAANRVTPNPQRDPVRRGEVAHRVTEEKHQFAVPRSHLSGRVDPNGRGVVLSCCLEMAAEDYVQPGQPADRTYQLSCVTFHANNHYTTLTRKLNPADGRYTSYYRDGEKATQPMDDEACAQFLEQRATQVVSFDYFQPAALQTAITQAPRIARRFRPVPTSGTQAEEKARGIEDKVLGKQKPIRNTKSGKTVTLVRVQGDINDTSRRVVVEFADETLSTVRANTAARRALTALGGKLPPKQWFRAQKTIPVRKGSRTTILVNPGTTEESLKEAVQGVLKTHAEEGVEIAFPLPTPPPTAKARDIVEQAIIGFALRETKCNVTVKVVLTEAQAKEIERAAPAIPAAPAASQYLVQTKIAPPRRLWGHYGPIPFNMNVVDKKPDNGIEMGPGVVKALAHPTSTTTTLRDFLDRTLGKAKTTGKKEITFVCPVKKTITEQDARKHAETFIKKLSAHPSLRVVEGAFKRITLTFVQPPAAPAPAAPKK